MRRFNSLFTVILLPLIALAGPKIFFESEDIDLGKLVQGESKEFSFVVYNKGDAVLDITEVRPTCGCTSTGKNNFSLKPGQKSSIPFTFNTGNFSGEQHKSMSVRSNDPEKPTVNLHFRALIESMVNIDPSYISMSAPVIGNAVSQAFKITNQYSFPLKTVDIEIVNIDNLIVDPKMPLKNMSVASDSSLSVTVSAFIASPLADSEYGQLKISLGFADGKKLERVMGVSIRK